MPSKKSSKKTRNKEKKERKTAAARAPPAQQNASPPTEGERIFAQAMMEDPEKLNEYIATMVGAGHTAEGAVSELIASLQFRSDEEEGRQQQAAFNDQVKTCDREGCEAKGEFLCVGCKCHYYCGKECQRLAWRTLGHKQDCKLLTKCREIGAMPRSVAMQDCATFGVVRTKNHGNHVVCMEKYKVVGDESDRLVPLASVAFDGESPTYAQVTLCLVNAILHPDFDTKCAGARRPCNVKIQSESFGDVRVAEHLAAVCHRLDIFVTDMVDNSTNDDDEWESSWFCVQQGWNDEIESDSFLKAISVSRRHPVPLDGSVRKDQLQMAEEYNKLALGVASTPPNLDALRKKVMRLPYEQEQRTSSFQRRTTGIAVVKGVLHVLTIPDQEFLHQQRVVLDTTTNRPSPNDVLSAIYNVLIRRKYRPSILHLGQPSICSHQDVETYEEALDESIVRGNCSLAFLGSIEDFVERALPRWRRMGIQLLVDDE